MYKQSLAILAFVVLAAQLCCLSTGCEAQTNSSTKKMEQSEEEHKHTNELINETSPYLLQHAHNPVDWYPWGEEAFEKAKKENKLVIVSIGYSACHWCHVMEHESFENEKIADLMNEKFICIKVDREERPDVDQVYMNAVQLMTGRGGWPLNCFTLPDGRPVYGGTYFQPDNWIQVLNQLSDLYTNDSSKAEEYAAKLTEGVRSSEQIIKVEETNEFEFETLKQMVDKWMAGVDNIEGGPNRSPKFPMPNNYQFLMQYAYLSNDKKVKDFVMLTLDKMAYGGIYDQIGGGFARYSTDVLWKVPHFEKMLYDNAQLVSLYSQAYQWTKNEKYKTIVEETIEFVERELTSEEGAFYSALDADSEGEEGKFYIWTEEELKQLLGDDFNWFAEYYYINRIGKWEHDNFILLKKPSSDLVAEKFGFEASVFETKLKKVKKQLLEVRDKRIHPGLDDKTLTSWNALMIKGCVDAYHALGETKYLDIALRNANFIEKNQLKKDGSLFHSYKEGRSTINGYLEDYCFVIEAYISLYEATFDPKWLNKSKELMDYSIRYFFNEENGMFYFTSTEDAPLIARKLEVYDNVIPASNSSIANSLQKLGHYFDHADYLQKALQMLHNVEENMNSYGSGNSNWASLALQFTQPYFEIAIVGDDSEKLRKQLNKNYLPNKLILGTKKKSNLPLLENKYVKGETLIYVCQNKACKLPVNKVNQALEQLK